MADTSIETVPMAAHEAQAERYTRIIVFTAIGWAVSVLLLSIILMFAISTEVETLEEVVTTETTTDVAQHAEDSGSNYFSGGDMNNGNANGQPTGEDNSDGKGNAD